MFVFVGYGEDKSKHIFFCVNLSFNLTLTSENTCRCKQNPKEAEKGFT